jgi:hypothetical protein
MTLTFGIGRLNARAAQQRQRLSAPQPGAARRKVAGMRFPSVLSRRSLEKIEPPGFWDHLGRVVSRHSTFSPLRAAGTMVMLLAWLAVSNHCALGALVKIGRSAQAHARCCGHQAPPAGKGLPDSGTRECCRTLHVLPVDAPARIVKSESAPLDFAPAWGRVGDALCRVVVPVTARMEGGPPGFRSFAEVVLQRSLRSHAPPLAA